MIDGRTEVADQAWWQSLRERTNSYDVVATQNEIARLLVNSAEAEATNLCQVPFCDYCNEFRRVWWSMCNALDIPTRRGLQRELKILGVPLPAGPYEEEV